MVAITTEPSRFDPNKSTFQCPTNVTVKEFFSVVVFPRDQFNNPRYGVDDASALQLLTSNVSNRLSLTYGKVSACNDSLVVSAQAMAAGPHQLRIEGAESHSPLQGCPFDIQSQLSLAPANCTLSGDGIVPGLQGLDATITVDLKDQFGAAFVLPPGL
ncbi:hypothetical protein LTS18_001253, partial [Coniosporium uncinatum]